MFVAVISNILTSSWNGSVFCFLNYFNCVLLLEYLHIFKLFGLCDYESLGSVLIAVSGLMDAVHVVKKEKTLKR